jgi:hypothetical protein
MRVGLVVCVMSAALLPLSSSSPCEAELNATCGVEHAAGTKKCDKCTRHHRAALEAVGCVEAVMHRWCNHSASPPPPHPPPAPPPHHAARRGCQAHNPFVSYSFDSDGPTCHSFEGLADLARGPFGFSPELPGTFFIGSPCRNVSSYLTNCTSFAGNITEAIGYSYGPGGECFPLGSTEHLMTPGLSSGRPTATAATGTGDGEAAIVLDFAGGYLGTTLRFSFVCDPTASPTAGPINATELSVRRCVVWAGCSS